MGNTGLTKGVAAGKNLREAGGVVVLLFTDRTGFHIFKRLGRKEEPIIDF